MIIRIAGQDDVNALHRLIERAYRGDSARNGWTHEADLLGGQRTDVIALSAIIGDPSQRILIANDFVGCANISDHGGGSAYLGLLAVDPDRQAAGVGKALIDAAETLAISIFGATVLEMTVIKQRSELIAYYERRGYAVTDEERPFPHDDPRFGLPTTQELSFIVLRKALD
jgi:GNAT superfamily N-acetyltransferase